MEVDGDDLAHDILSQSVLEDDFEVEEPQEREKILAAVKALASSSSPAGAATTSTDPSTDGESHTSSTFTPFLMEQPSVPLSAIEDSPIPSASNSSPTTPAKSHTLSPVTEMASKPPFNTHNLSDIKSSDLPPSSTDNPKESNALPSASLQQGGGSNIDSDTGLEYDNDVNKGALEIKAALVALWYDSYQPFVSKDVFTDR